MSPRRLSQAGVALLLAFVALAGVVLAFGPGPVLGEDALLASLEASRTPERTALVLGVTALGGWSGQLPLVAAATLLLAVSGRRRAAAGLAALCLAGYAVMSAAKLAFGRPRPDAAQAVYEASGLSFPSGHATASAFFFVGLALLAAAEGRRWPLAALLPLAALVGLSRPFLGVHYPTDVLGGWLLAGGLTLLLAGRLARPGSPSG